MMQWRGCLWGVFGAPLGICLLSMHPTHHPSFPPSLPCTPTEEHDYHLLYSDRGSRVCMVASEPVTSAANDWVRARCWSCFIAVPSPHCGAWSHPILLAVPTLMLTCCPRRAAAPATQVEVPANTALVVCREKAGILNILLAPLGEQGSHTR